MNTYADQMATTCISQCNINGNDYVIYIHVLICNFYTQSNAYISLNHIFSVNPPPPPWLLLQAWTGWPSLVFIDSFSLFDPNVLIHYLKRYILL